jgi:hypothetical protein
VIGHCLGQVHRQLVGGGGGWLEQMEQVMIFLPDGDEHTAPYAHYHCNFTFIRQHCETSVDQGTDSNDAA